MSDNARDAIRKEVLSFFGTQNAPEDFGRIVDGVTSRPDFSDVRESDVVTVVQSMIVTGKLEYAPGLAIRRTESNVA